MTKEPESGDPATQPPRDTGTSKMGIACVGLLILIVVGIIAVAAMASSG
jgi:hypothetical protein